MSNHLPKPKRKPFFEILNTNEYAKEAAEASGEDLRRFIKNNAKLLSKANKSVYRQCKEITEKSGFVLSQSVLSGIKVGKQRVCNTFIVYVVAKYWGVKGTDMLSKDIDDIGNVA